MKKAVLILGALGVLTIAAPASASASPPGGWWPFYENSGTVAHDLSPNHNNGTLSGNVQWAPGFFGPGLTFDGGTGRVDIPNSPSLDPGNAVTTTAFVKYSGDPGGYIYITAKGGTDCQAASWGLYTGPGHGLMFYVSQNGGSSYTRSPDAGTGVWDGNWHFIVGTYDGTAVRLYVDGKQIGNGTPLTGPIGYGLDGNNDLWFGHYPTCGGLDWPGSIDEPTVWSTAWSPLQVQLTYNILSALHGWISRLPSFPGPSR